MLEEEADLGSNSHRSITKEAVAVTTHLNRVAINNTALEVEEVSNIMVVVEVINRVEDMAIVNKAVEDTEGGSSTMAAAIVPSRVNKTTLVADMVGAKVMVVAEVDLSRVTTHKVDMEAGSSTMVGAGADNNNMAEVTLNKVEVILNKAEVKTTPGVDMGEDSSTMEVEVEAVNKVVVRMMTADTAVDDNKDTALVEVSKGSLDMQEEEEANPAIAVAVG